MRPSSDSQGRREKWREDYSGGAGPRRGHPFGHDLLRRPAFALDRVEADRLIVALDRNASVCDLPPPAASPPPPATASCPPTASFSRAAASEPRATRQSCWSA